MYSAVSLTSHLLLAAVLFASAVAKLRAPQRAKAAFSALKVPKLLDRAAVVRLHPWAEIILATLLLTAAGPLGVVVPALVILLMLGYLVLVFRAMRSPYDVDCSCFGALGGERITLLTVFRNTWLLVVAGAALWSSSDGASATARLARLSGSEVWWLVAVASTALTVALVLGQGRGGTPDPRGEGGDTGESAELGDYIRTRTPAVPFQLGDGSESDLRTLSRDKAQLLVFVSEACGNCAEVMQLMPHWREALPQLDIRLVVRQAAQNSRLASTEDPMSLHDPRGLLRDTLDVHVTPMAVLLGADGLLAGGPVQGPDSIREFVAAVYEELGATATPLSPASG